MNSFKDNYKLKSIINYNNNLFCFENSNIKNFKRYFSFIFKSNINFVNKYMRDIKFIILLKIYFPYKIFYFVNNNKDNIKLKINSKNTKFVKVYGLEKEKI